MAGLPAATENFLTCLEKAESDLKAIGRCFEREFQERCAVGTVRRWHGASLVVMRLRPACPASQTSAWQHSAAPARTAACLQGVTQGKVRR